jgi:hypothetical protein
MIGDRKSEGDSKEERVGCRKRDLKEKERRRLALKLREPRPKIPACLSRETHRRYPHDPRKIFTFHLHYVAEMLAYSGRRAALYVLTNKTRD